MRFVCVERADQDKEIKAAVKILAHEVEDDGGTADPKAIEAYIRDAVSSEANGRFMLVYDKDGDPAGVSAFNVCTDLKGKYLWVSSFHFPDDDSMAAYAEDMAKQVIAWAKEHGCRRIAAAAERTDMEMKEIAEALSMTSKRMVLLELEV